jgi:iron complex transport system ATP-binding protein
MECISFNDVSFTYPMVEGDLDAEGKQIVPKPVFYHFSAELPGGFVSLVGPNGSGKSTFLLLASGRIVPQEGKCLLFGKDVASLPEEQKNLVASVIYQNMEFESREKVCSLLDTVFKSGNYKGKACGIHSEDLLKEVIEQFELGGLLDRGLMEISKGEIQRVLLAFSMLYGSASIFMDEPLFALEPRQKESALSYIKEFSAKTGTAVFISMHELELSKKYAEKVMLFYPDRNIDFGTPDEVLTSEDLEKAYGVPASMLKHSEDMTREELMQTAEAVLAVQKTAK